jgi:ABC-type dipeptide/oligopeptide/nickel transport system permease subunit
MKILIFLRSLLFALLFATLIVQGMFIALGVNLENIWKMPIIVLIVILSIPMYFVVHRKIFKQIKSK